MDAQGYDPEQTNGLDRGDAAEQDNSLEEAKSLVVVDIVEPSSGYETPKIKPAARLGDDRDLARFLIGLLLLGRDELVQGLGGEAEAGAPTEEDASGDQFRHLTLGLLARGQRQASRALRAAYTVSVGTASLTFHTLDRLTDNWLMRPFRRPIEARIQSWSEEAVEIMEEGQREEQDSRALAADRVETLVEYVFDRIAESQELDDLILELVGKKSVTYGGRLVDNLRTLTATADYVVEGALRKLLRRTPRRELPPSPLQGQPQTMYDSLNLARGVMDDA